MYLGFDTWNREIEMFQISKSNNPNQKIHLPIFEELIKKGSEVLELETEKNTCRNTSEATERRGSEGSEGSEGYSKGSNPAFSSKNDEKKTKTCRNASEPAERSLPSEATEPNKISYKTIENNIFFLDSEESRKVSSD